MNPDSYITASEKMTEQAQAKIRAVPDLVRREGLAALICLAGLFLLSALWDAPVQGPADPGGTAVNGVKAPWVFLGIQLILLVLPAELAGLIAPMAGMLILAAIPFLAETAGLVRRLAFYGVVTIGAVLTVWGFLR